MKALRVIAPCALMVWLLMCFLPSRDMGEFAHRVGADVGYMFRLASVALGLFGVPYLVYDALRRRMS